MRILLADANVLIDLLSSSLLDRCGGLPTEMLIPRAVLMEVDEIDEETLPGFLTVVEDEIENSTTYPSSLSLADRICYSVSLSQRAILLTGDQQLRRFAEKEGLEVHGTIWVMDLLLENGLCSKTILIQAMNTLLSINPRLPVKTCHSRINKWGML